MSRAEKAARLAEEYELRYHGCSQSTLLAVMESLGFVDEETARAAHPLGGGVGLSGEGTCGALLAAVMAVGLFYGRGIEEMRKGKTGMKAYALARAVLERFREEMGGTSCCQIQRRKLGRCYSAWSSEDMREFERLGGHRVCASIAAYAARLAVEAIENPEKLLGQTKQIHKDQ